VLLQYEIAFTQYYANIKRSCNPTNIFYLCVAVAATPKPIHIGVLIPPSGANSTARNVTIEQQVRKTHACSSACVHAYMHAYIHRTYIYTHMAFLKYVHFRISLAFLATDSQYITLKRVESLEYGENLQYV